MEKILIDVREAGEYKEAHLQSAINIPLSSFNISDFEPYKDKFIDLICHSGRRALEVKERLEAQGFQHVHVMDLHMQDLKIDAAIHKSSGWTIDRQFRLLLGLLLLIYLIGTFTFSVYFVIIPIILCVGLIFTSLIDRCYLRMLVAQMPWNKNRKD